MTNQLEFRTRDRRYRQVPEQPYGKQLQVDFGEYRTRSRCKLYIFAAVLAASRYKYVRFQDRPFTTLEVIVHLLECFDCLGGMPVELVIDQDSLLVVAENHGDIIYTKEFSFFIEEMGLQMYVCRKADPESKGKIENVIKFLKYNFLSCRDFEAVAEANQSLRKWLKRRANGKISQATKRIPAEMFDEERGNLRPIRNSVFRKDSLQGREERLADEKSMISVS
jgi:transposase